MKTFKDVINEGKFMTLKDARKAENDYDGADDLWDTLSDKAIKKLAKAKKIAKGAKVDKNEDGWAWFDPKYGEWRDANNEKEMYLDMWRITANEKPEVLKIKKSSVFK